MTGLNRHSDLPDDLEQLASRVVDCLFAVHRELGPGFLEKIYEDALVQEFGDRQIGCQRQKNISIFYKGKKLPSDYKIDLLIEDRIILELKAVERLVPVHEAQLISYMKQHGSQLGFLVNFNTPLIKDGIKRVVLSNFASSRLRG